MEEALHLLPKQSKQSRLTNRVRRIWEEISTEEAENSPEEREPVVSGTLASPEEEWLPAASSTFILTCAQSNTFMHDAWWNNLRHFAEVMGAELHVSRFTYNKQAFGKNSVKPGTHEADDGDVWYDPRIEPYVSDEPVQLAKDLIWFGNLNILPTRVDPLNGFESHGRGASVIVPHTRMAMKSVPVMKGAKMRAVYSTGTVTQRNYIEKAAGQKASLHHVYGALLVEIDENGEWWVRQLNADTDGSFYDLGSHYFTGDDGKPASVAGIRAKIITHGDLHGAKVDLDVLEAMSDVVDVLYPEHQVFHDIIDFMPRNHHNIKDPHFLHEMFTKGADSVMAEFQYIGMKAAQYLARPDTKHHIVTSNHDQAIEAWLRNTMGFSDPPNMHLWLTLNKYCAEARASKIRPRPFWKTLKHHLSDTYIWNIVHEDDSLVIAGIENGLHGHLGPNGARGTPKNLRHNGKANTGHTHSAGIVEGVYTAGVFGKLDMGYNKGLSSWSHSFVLTYPNGKRAIMTLKNGKAWR